MPDLPSPKFQNTSGRSSPEANIRFIFSCAPSPGIGFQSNSTPVSSAHFLTIASSPGATTLSAELTRSIDILPYFSSKALGSLIIGRVPSKLMIPASTASFSSAVSSPDAVLPDAVLPEAALLAALPESFLLSALPPQPDNKLTTSVIQVNIDNNFFPFILLSFFTLLNIVLYLNPIRAKYTAFS